MSGPLSSGLLACAVCFGSGSGELARGAQAGVLVLAVVITVVLGGIVAAIWTFRGRALRLEADEKGRASELSPVLPSEGR